MTLLQTFYSTMWFVLCGIGSEIHPILPVPNSLSHPSHPSEGCASHVSCREVAPDSFAFHYVVCVRFGIDSEIPPISPIVYPIPSNFTSTQGMRLTRPNAGRLPQLAGSSCRPHNLLLPICCRPQPPPQTPNMLPPNIPNMLPQFVASFCFDKKI